MKLNKNKTHLTSDPNDQRLGFGINSQPAPQNEAYLILSDDTRKDFVRPVRYTYLHLTCGSETTMGEALAETYATKPQFYGATYCVHCAMHRPVGENGEFTWLDGTKVGT